MTKPLTGPRAFRLALRRLERQTARRERSLHENGQTVAELRVHNRQIADARDAALAEVDRLEGELRQAQQEITKLRLSAMLARSAPQTGPAALTEDDGA